MNRGLLTKAFHEIRPVSIGFGLLLLVVETALAYVLPKMHDNMFGMVMKMDFTRTLLLAQIVVTALDRFTAGVYDTRNTEQLRILGEALAWVREHAGEDLTLEAVARACHKNPSTLRKLFREQLGMTFSDYVNRLRVENAIEQLRDPHKSLAEIAVEVGFYDQSHFGKVFRQMTGYTPALYRKKML